MKIKRSNGRNIKVRLQTMTLCAFFAAVMCVLSLVAIPVGTVPLTLSLVGVMLAPAVLGFSRGMISVLLYLLIGMAGVPVFSGFQGGISALLSPKGGYILSYPIVALFVGAFLRFLERDFFGHRLPRSFSASIACVISLVPCYLFGTFVYSLVCNVDFSTALKLCVLPFLPIDFIKCILVGFLSQKIKRMFSREGNKKTG